jgi:hypothetical protein
MLVIIRDELVLRRSDRVEPEIPQGHASGLKTAKPADAQSPFTPEKTAPMLEVRAPRRELLTSKGFFIHIATIVIGLFCCKSRTDRRVFSPPTSVGTTAIANAGSLRKRSSIRRR